jgi:hypothetical protein
MGRWEEKEMGDKERGDREKRGLRENLKEFN